MLAEFGFSAYAALRDHSVALLAFGSDSLVELLSASVVLMQHLPGISLSRQKATRAAAILLFVLAGVVVTIALAGLILDVQPCVSRMGMGITIAALIAMPALSFFKRREARRNNDPALAADAVQSATCAYLAFVTLAGLVANALFHIAWFDTAAALIAVPILVREGLSAWQGNSCGCC